MGNAGAGIDAPAPADKTCVALSAYLWEVNTMAELSMRALYYVQLACEDNGDALARAEDTKTNENYLNQNFTIIAQKIAELEARIEALEA